MATTLRAGDRKDSETKLSEDLPECLKQLWMKDVKLLKRQFNPTFLEEAALLSLIV